MQYHIIVKTNETLLKFESEEDWTKVKQLIKIIFKNDRVVEIYVYGRKKVDEIYALIKTYNK